MSSIGTADLAATAMAVQAQSRSQTMATSMIKQQASQEQALADMLAEGAKMAAANRTPLPEGQGQNVDITV